MKAMKVERRQERSKRREKRGRIEVRGVANRIKARKDKNGKRKEEEEKRREQKLR